VRFWMNLTFVVGITLFALGISRRSRFEHSPQNMWRCHRHQRGDLFIGRQLHDRGFRHRIALTMEAARTI
jgi:hypothetical protein